MNEVTKIHLGRQPFVIAVDAHKLLEDYLLAIKRQVGKNSEGVVEEVEMRMAELLAERGIGGEKVILLEDIEFLKQQLGAPGDFKDDDEAAGSSSKTETGEPADPSRRLFRDTEHGIIAGVSSGLANYFNIDAVIIRILFVIATVTGGWGIPVYIVMWLVMPEARSASERLQMRGKAVTVDSLKEIVDRADVAGAAQRASRSMATIFETAARLLLVLIGVVITTVATALLAAAGMVGAYALLHNGHFVHGAVVVPVGTTETVAAWAALAMAVVFIVFILATGIAMVRRKWLVPGWAVAALCGLFLVGAITAGAAMPDTIQGVRTRYESSQHVETRTLSPFQRVRLIRAQGMAPVPVTYENDAFTDEPARPSSPDTTLPAMPKPPVVPINKDASNTYTVTLRYVGPLPVSDIKTTVKDGTLTIDTTAFNPGPTWDCDVACIGTRDFFQLIIHTPQPVDGTVWE